MNNLDRAVKAVRRSRAGLPEVYRQLTAGDLRFLVPFHPEGTENLVDIGEARG
jgi:hypothetical protein